MIEALTRKLEARDKLSNRERDALEAAVGRVKEFQPDTDIVADGSRPAESSLLISGLACRYKLLADGARQITALHVHGDFVDLHGFLLRRMDHGVAALSTCRVALFPHDRLRRITEEHPHLTRLLWLMTLIDAAIHREWMTGMGRRRSAGQVAHFICEQYLRLAAVGLAKNYSFELPLTQQELADAMGQSLVQMNRVLGQLRRQRLVTWSRNAVTIEDWERLAEIAQFDPTYLSLQQEAR